MCPSLRWVTGSWERNAYHSSPLLLSNLFGPPWAAPIWLSRIGSYTTHPAILYAHHSRFTFGPLFSLVLQPNPLLKMCTLSWSYSTSSSTYIAIRVVCVLLSLNTTQCPSTAVERGQNLYGFSPICIAKAINSPGTKCSRAKKPTGAWNTGCVRFCLSNCPCRVVWLTVFLPFCLSLSVGRGGTLTSSACSCVL